MGEKAEATSAVLNAASHSLHHACHPAFSLYMHCRRSTLVPSPDLCQHLARSVIDCTNGHFAAIAESPCQPLFRRLWRCLDNNDQNVIYCRNEERAFYECASAGYGIGGDRVPVRRLWSGCAPGEYKADCSGAEEGRWPFQWHVWWNKNHKPQD